MKDIKKILNEMVPENLKESYDNVGLMIGDLKAEIDSVLIALDCTMEVIEEARQLKCNFIITHHPLLFLKPDSITTETILGNKIEKLIKNDINVYACHTNLDIVSGGLNDIIANLLGFDTWQVLEEASEKKTEISYGVGRLVLLENPLTLKEICYRVKENLKLSHLKYAGDDNMIINKIAIVNGSGEDYFKAAKLKGADCIITGDTTYHYVSDYVEDNMAVIDAGHFETEWPAMQVFAEKLQKKLIELGYKNEIIVSKASRPIYKFI